MERRELKDLVLNQGMHNKWKGYIGLYLTTSQLRILKRYVPSFKRMSMKDIYSNL